MLSLIKSRILINLYGYARGLLQYEEYISKHLKFLRILSLYTTCTSALYMLEGILGV
ncbi:hypothetical protein [Candidatus Lariskella endosymbiont of Epinotia ramella]|uniref:hypothetical protein n=1 Tax=Candidatus Lariskella endosymbiont of Epinotia ramella TaxID=3066224 RepID=UPI0030D346D0